MMAMPIKLPYGRYFLKACSAVSPVTSAKFP